MGMGHSQHRQVKADRRDQAKCSKKLSIQFGRSSLAREERLVAKWSVQGRNPNLREFLIYGRELSVAGCVIC